MASSNEYRRWIDETRREQRVLRNYGCHEAARRLESDLHADHCELSRAMDREEREEHARSLERGDFYEHDDHS